MPASFEGEFAQAGSPTVDRWWQLYDDPQLNGLIARAFDVGFDVRIALARLEEAGALRREALSSFRIQGDIKIDGEIRRAEILQGGGLSIPGLPAGTSLGNFTTPALSKSANATLPVSWELDLFGRRTATDRAALADIDAARFEYLGARAALAAGVARGLFEARGLAAQLDDSRATVVIQRRLLDTLTRRVERGIAARSEVDRVAADVAQADAQAADLGAALEASKRALLVLIGAGTDPRAGVRITAAVSPLPPTPATLPGELLVRRPDIGQAEARLRGAAGRVRLAELAFYPVINLQAAVGLGFQSAGVSTTAASASAGGGIVAPLFDRARLRAQLGGASARAEQAVLAYEQSVQTAYGEVDRALVRFAADRRRVDLLVDGAARADRAFDAARIRYQRGLADLQELLDAERTQRAARTALTGARIEALQRSVQLFQALGGGWAAPTAEPRP